MDNDQASEAVVATFVKVISPLSENGSVSLVKEWCGQEIIQLWSSVLDIDVSPWIAPTQRIRLFHCNDSQLQFYWPRGIEASEELYGLLGRRFNWYYEHDKWEFRCAASGVFPGMHVLEIGSGVGAFLAMAKARGAEVNGIEGNRWARDVANSHGCFTVCAIDELPSEARFDIVCAFQVLEHVSNLKAFIETCIELCKPGGRIILSVPNYDGYLRWANDVLELPPHHLSLWRLRTFEYITRCYPIRIVSAKREPLRECHTRTWIDAQLSRLRQKNIIAKKILFNRISIPLMMKMMSMGLRKYLTGHTICVEFVRS